jgi:NCAIR mutase (PurE)-related protein
MRMDCSDGITAVMKEAHAIVSESGQWVCNEKRLIDKAGVSGVHRLLSTVPDRPRRPWSRTTKKVNRVRA